MDDKSKVRTLIWDGSKLFLIDQRKLPFIEDYVVCDTFKKVGLAIKDMIVRGAPAIGVSAAYGAALAGMVYEGSSKEDFRKYFEKALQYIAASRPTAVNLFWALKRMKDVFNENEKSDIASVKKILISEAEKIEFEDILINKKIGDNGIEAFKDFKGKVKILNRGFSGFALAFKVKPCYIFCHYDVFDCSNSGKESGPGPASNRDRSACRRRDAGTAGRLH